MTETFTAPLGAKARAILRVCALPLEERDAHWAALEQQFARKALWRKAVELQQRGYLHASGPWPSSWLTDKGRHALETMPMRG